MTTFTCEQLSPRIGMTCLLFLLAIGILAFTTPLKAEAESDTTRATEPLTLEYISVPVSPASGTRHWGYLGGLKQPLGAYHDGLSIHQANQSDGTTGDANPDYILIVDESGGGTPVASINSNPTEQDSSHHRPGGMVGFTEEGNAWLAYMSHPGNIDLRLAHALDPRGDFTIELMPSPGNEEYPKPASTAVCLAVEDPHVMLFWRNGYSHGGNDADTTVAFRRYDFDANGLTSTDPDLSRELAGCIDSFDWVTTGFDANPDHIPPTQRIGIEQLWTRHDPRGFTCATWQWFAKETDVHNIFGSNPFVYSYDSGETWKMADGTLLPLPITYDHGIELIDDEWVIDYGKRAVLIPDDHLLEYRATGMIDADLGMAPRNTFWMTSLHGADYTPPNPLNEPAPALETWVNYWFFDANDSQEPWKSIRLTPDPNDPVAPGYVASKSHACGSTDDFQVFLYAAHPDPSKLMMRWSDDDGVTWSDPEEIEDVDSPENPNQSINWISFVQPAGDYDDCARFFYFFSDNNDQAGRYENEIRWARIKIHRTIGAKIDIEPRSGALPFATTITATLLNKTDYFRTIRGQLNINQASGNVISNFRSGYTTVPGSDAGGYGSYSTSWNQTIPAVGSLVGDNTFEFAAADITAAPYNQPPYPASGDTSVEFCTVVGKVP